MSSDIIVRSGPSRKTCYLRFINRTTRKVSVIWIDYVGAMRKYGTLEPYRHFDIHTYEGHPWVSEDINTGRRMYLNKVEIFIPLATSRETARNGEFRCYLPFISNNELAQNNRFAIQRMSVYITLPVIPLVELCAEIIVQSIKKEENIKELELPCRLQEMLTDFYNHH